MGSGVRVGRQRACGCDGDYGASVWFPVSYGGEFEVRGLFFYKRKISVAMQNTEFRKTDGKSTLVYAMDAH
jgi:hypothetical protein